MKIVFIAGTWYKKGAYLPIWGNVSRALRAHYPDATFVYKQAWYHLWELEKMKALSDSIVAEEDTGEDILLVGHSMGGIMACGIAKQFKQSRVLGIVTIFSPHELGKYLPRLDFYKKIYGGVSDPQVPIISFGGYLDPLVWWWRSRHPRSMHHVNFLSDHRFLLGWRKHIAETIASITREYIEPISAK
jgi:alpha-beta hydrolase superfamily lysophospholipase